jgi:DNA-binding NarL/FixJ family response regulator
MVTGFLAVLEPEKDIQATVISGRIPELIGEIQNENSSVLLIDMPRDFDCDILAELQRRWPDLKVVLWAESISVELAHRAIALGVRGILREDSPNDHLARCLRNVSGGEMWFDGVLLNALLGMKKVRLSRREGQLMRLASQGLCNKEMAFTLGIAEGTVKVYLSKLFKKVGVTDRFELALYGLRNLGLETVERPKQTQVISLPHPLPADPSFVQ